MKRSSKNQLELTLEPEMANAQDLYNFVYKACDYLRGPVGHESFKDYLTPLLYYKRLSDTCSADEMGNAYEYLVGKFADDAGNTAQEFYELVA